MSIQAVTTVEATGAKPESLRQLAAQAGAADGGKTAPATGQPLPQRVSVPEPHPMAVPVQDVHKSAAQIDDFLKRSGHQLSIVVDQALGRFVVQVRDPSTGDLIRQIPSDEVLRIARSLETAGAALIDELS